jgi:hypothetical protein
MNKRLSMLAENKNLLEVGGVNINKNFYVMKEID